MLNLCVNARDAMPRGGQLTISLENLVVDENYSTAHLDAKPGDYVVISVSDTGAGIPPEVRDRIFEPFFTTKELGKGTGLGLSTSLAIVKSHDGFITVQSEPGKGTTFKAHLPANRISENEARLGQPVEWPQGHGELILVVDDEEAYRTVLTRSLERHGYRTVSAANGGGRPDALHQAIKRHRRHHHRSGNARHGWIGDHPGFARY
ncbi:MAG: ATP-binding protein [Limisphaerales bacterium]